jgi:hypothetical protein
MREAMQEAASGIGGHHARRRGLTTDDWITPRSIIEALGSCDLDPCASLTQPWPCAAQTYTVRENGLLRTWKGRVWLNPPYGRRAADWLSKLAAHGNGIALVFARTDTEMFFRHVWSKATSLLFLRGRVTFYRPDGKKSAAGHNSGGPSVLIAYGVENTLRLATCGLPGAYVDRFSA